MISWSKEEQSIWAEVDLVCKENYCVILFSQLVSSAKQQVGEGNGCVTQISMFVGKISVPSIRFSGISVGRTSWRRNNVMENICSFGNGAFWNLHLLWYLDTLPTFVRSMGHFYCNFHESSINVTKSFSSLILTTWSWQWTLCGSWCIEIYWWTFCFLCDSCLWCSHMLSVIHVALSHIGSFCRCLVKSTLVLQECNEFPIFPHKWGLAGTKIWKMNEVLVLILCWWQCILWIVGRVGSMIWLNVEEFINIAQWGSRKASLEWNTVY